MLLKFSCGVNDFIDVSFGVITSDNITVQTGVFQVLENITASLGLGLTTVNKCQNKTGKY